VNPTRLLAILLLLPTAAGAFSISESVDGDSSGDRLVPTALVASLGSNTLTGSTVSGDLDYVRITLPPNLWLSSLVLTSVTSADDLAFIAVQSGTTFSVTPAQADPAVLLGYAHFGTSGTATPATDILDNMAAAFGVIGFTPPLIGSDYTFWIQQTSAQAFGYAFDFVVVPESGTGALVLLGLLGLALARRARA
jgi:hypothetical protein